MGEWRSGSAALLHGEGRRFDPYLAYQNYDESSTLSSPTIKQMFELVIILSLLLDPSNPRQLQLEFDHRFHSLTGCYLTGSSQVSKMVLDGWFDGLTEDQLTIEIECDDGAT